EGLQHGNRHHIHCSIIHDDLAEGTRPRAGNQIGHGRLLLASTRMPLFVVLLRQSAARTSSRTDPKTGSPGKKYASMVGRKERFQLTARTQGVRLPEHHCSTSETRVNSSQTAGRDRERKGLRGACKRRALEADVAQWSKPAPGDARRVENRRREFLWVTS